MHQEIISGIARRATKASLNLDSVFVLISEEIMAMKKIMPEAKKGKGQYTILLHSDDPSGD